MYAIRSYYAPDYSAGNPLTLQFEHGMCEFEVSAMEPNREVASQLGGYVEAGCRKLPAECLQPLQYRHVEITYILGP